MTRYRPKYVLDMVAVAARREGISKGSVLAHTNEPAAVRARRRVMRQLHAEGWSLSRIGRVFMMEHSTVRYHLLKRSDTVEIGPYPCPDYSGEWAI